MYTAEEVLAVVSLGDRLKSLRSIHKLRQEDLAERVQVSRTAVGHWETGNTEPDTDTLRKLADIFHVSIDYLLGRTDAAREPSPLSEVQASGADARNFSFRPEIRLPVFGEIAAGTPCIADQVPETYELVRDEWLSDKTSTYFWLRVKGNSMRDAGIVEGALALIHCQPTFEPDQIGVVLVNGEEATLKRIRQVDTTIILLSANPDFPPQYYPAEDVKVIGILVMTQKGYLK